MINIPPPFLGCKCNPIGPSLNSISITLFIDSNLLLTPSFIRRFASNFRSLSNFFLFIFLFLPFSNASLDNLVSSLLTSIGLFQVNWSSAGRYQKVKLVRVSVAINHPFTNIPEAKANLLRNFNLASLCLHARCIQTAPRISGAK